MTIDLLKNTIKEVSAKYFAVNTQNILHLPLFI